MNLETPETQAGDALGRALGIWEVGERDQGLGAQTLLFCPVCLNLPGALPRLCWEVVTNPQYPGGPQT